MSGLVWASFAYVALCVVGAVAGVITGRWDVVASCVIFGPLVAAGAIDLARTDRRR